MAIITRTFKTKIFPNKTQKEQIFTTLDACEFIYNFFLKRFYEELKETDKPPRFFPNWKYRKEMTQMRKDPKYPFLQKADRVALDNHLIRLHRAYNEHIVKKCRMPGFKNSDKYVRSYTTATNNIKLQDRPTIELDNKSHKIKLPKLGWVRCGKGSVPYDNFIVKTVTIMCVGNRDIFISCVLDITLNIEPMLFNPKSVGIDLGFKSYATLSNGTKYTYPRYLRQYFHERQNLRDRWFELKGGNNEEELEKVTYKLHKLERKIRNKRLNFFYNLATKILTDHDIIYIERMQVRKLLTKEIPKIKKVRSRIRLAYMDFSFYTFQRILFSKAEVMNKVVYFVPETYNSTKTCHKCGYLNNQIDAKAIGKTRTWVCPNCNAIHDRDINAAINILYNGRWMLIHKYVRAYQIKENIKPLNKFFILNNCQPNKFKVISDITEY